MRIRAIDEIDRLAKLENRILFTSHLLKIHDRRMPLLPPFEHTYAG